MQVNAKLLFLSKHTHSLTQRSRPLNALTHLFTHSLSLQVNARQLFDVLEVKALPNEYIEKLMDHLSAEFHEDGEHIYTVTHPFISSHILS